MKKRKPKKVTYALIEPESEIGRPMYDRMTRLLDAHHEELADARIVLAWNTGWKPDVDGRCTLGMCKKASDLSRELAPYDFIVLLRREFWESDKVTDRQRDALLDHELQHATVAFDKDGEPMVDERGRTIFRIRKHDIEEFGAIVSRWGLWKRDLQWFVAQVPAGETVQEPLNEPPPDDGSLREDDQPHAAPTRDASWWNH